VARPPAVASWFSNRRFAIVTSGGHQVIRTYVETRLAGAVEQTGNATRSRCFTATPVAARVEPETRTAV